MEHRSPVIYLMTEENSGKPQIVYLLIAHGALWKTSNCIPVFCPWRHGLRTGKLYAMWWCLQSLSRFLPMVTCPEFHVNHICRVIRTMRWNQGLCMYCYGFAKYGGFEWSALAWSDLKPSCACVNFFPPVNSQLIGSSIRVS